MTDPVHDGYGDGDGDGGAAAARAVSSQVAASLNGRREGERTEGDADQRVGDAIDESLGGVMRGWAMAPLRTLRAVRPSPAMMLSAVMAFVSIVAVNSIVHVWVTDEAFWARLIETSTTLLVLVVVLAAAMWAGARGLCGADIDWGSMQIGTVIVMLPFAFGSVPGLAIPATLASLVGLGVLLRVRVGLALGRTAVVVAFALVALLLVGAMFQRLFGYGA